jgi:hypothetical protein
MISRIHSKLGTAGLVVAIVALVVALTGAAFAAAPGLNSKQKKEVKKIAKQFAGKPGSAGPQGPAGPQGAPGGKGDTGAEGSEGPQGEQGIQGKQGIQGEPGEPGEDGKDGEDGACSKENPVCVLPSGATETGAWGAANIPSIVALSFNLPLKEAPEGIHYVTEGGEEKVFEAGFKLKPATICTGEAENPTAPPGQICIYARSEFEFAPLAGGFFPAGGDLHRYKTGATFFYSVQESQKGSGTWAVTAK